MRTSKVEHISLFKFLVYVVLMNFCWKLKAPCSCCPDHCSAIGTVKMSCINLGWGKGSVQGKVKNTDWVSLVYLSRFEEAC